MSEAGPRAVFLSYASQDGETVRRVAEALRAVGVEVWFDLDELREGDAWDRKIRNQIRTCALFVPVISANTQARPEGYFRLEWHLAEQRSLLIAKGRAFIVPVCLDETKEGEALVPDGFLAVQWARPSSDLKLAQFVAQVQRLLNQAQPASRPSGSSAAVGPGSAFSGPPPIPDFELLRQIGRGGYGEVWLARGATGLWRAIKIVWRGRFADAEPFEREWRGLREFAAISLGASSHMALLHLGRNDEAGFFFYVMELADDAERGRTIDPASYVPLTLAELRRRRGRLAADEVGRIGLELAQTLAALHARGLVHRDIKPSNVILVNGVPKLADIGLVAPTTSAQTFVGTEGYVPPEGPGTPGGDVFALGKVLYELATGLDRQDYPRLPPGVAQLPDRRGLLALNEVILRACEPEAAKRYRDAALLQRDLEALSLGRRPRPYPLWPLAAAAVLALMIAGWAGQHWWSRPVPPPAVTTSPAAPAPAIPAASPASVSSQKSLIVLALENLSPDPADAAFTDGMHEEIIQTLWRLGSSGLKVLSRSTALSLKGSKESLPAIGRRFDVAYALSGSLRRSGRQVRVSLELRKTADESLVWQQRFEQELIDGFALQDEIAAEVAKVLQVHTSSGWFAGAKFMTKNAVAYELFLTARDLPATKGPGMATFGEQAELGERIMALDPEFMAGASLLSQAYAYLYTSSLGRLGGAERAGIAAKAKRWAQRASALMPGGAGDGALAVYYSRVEFDSERYDFHARNEVRALPNDPNAHNRMAGVFGNRGQTREALASYNQALALDPFHVRALYNRIRCAALLRDLPAFEAAAAKSLEFGGKNTDPGEIDDLRFRLTGRLPESLVHLASQPVAQAQLLWMSRRFTEVLAFTEPARTKDWSFRQLHPALVLRAGAAERLGRKEVKAESARRLLEIVEKDAVAGGVPEARQQGMKMWALVFAERKTEALATARWLVERLKAPTEVAGRWSSELDLATVHAWFGDAPETVEILARLIQLPSGVTVPHLRLSPEWDGVRNHPQFQALLADPKNMWPLGSAGPIPPTPVVPGGAGRAP